MACIVQYITQLYLSSDTSHHCIYPIAALHHHPMSGMHARTNKGMVSLNWPSGWLYTKINVIPLGAESGYGHPSKFKQMLQTNILLSYYYTVSIQSNYNKYYFGKTSDAWILKVWTNLESRLTGLKKPCNGNHSSTCSTKLAWAKYPPYFTWKVHAKCDTSNIKYSEPIYILLAWMGTRCWHLRTTWDLDCGLTRDIVISQARSQGGSDRSDDPPKIRPGPLFKVHIFVS